ncbi:MAG: PASTA domain-containing protein [Bacteroidia bacterium]|nr:PASTA domain-containing protein [Bacteroidia bacterium]MDW8417491.1 PASTA domain-containing protein [Bacteroidia bacterium]
MALLGIMSYFLFGSVFLKWVTRHGDEYVLPSLIGRKLSVVESSLNAAGFSVVVIDSQFVAGRAPYTILLQDPPSGTRIKRGRKIYLTITSATPPTVPFPMVREMPYEDAYRLLKETYGFQIGSVEYVTGKEPDIVLEARYKGKSIEHGTLIPKYSTIDLVVSRGYDERKVPFVSVVGLSLEEAIARLQMAGLSVGQIRYKPSPNLPPGQVYRQYPDKAPLDSLPAGTPVDIVVNSQPPAPLLSE